MAISDRIRAEADRTIEGMQRFCSKYSDDVDDAEELEHRIARIEASVEGCNGLTQEEKIQKTAENVFELTCAQERSYDSLRRELKRNRDEYRKECSEVKAEVGKVAKGVADLAKKIEESGMDSSSSSKKGDYKHVYKLVSEHPLLAFNTFILVLVLVFVSGHFESIVGLFKSTGNA